VTRVLGALRLERVIIDFLIVYARKSRYRTTSGTRITIVSKSEFSRSTSHFRVWIESARRLFGNIVPAAEQERVLAIGFRIYQRFVVSFGHSFFVARPYYFAHA